VIASVSFRHSREGRNPGGAGWIPAFAGMTTLRHLSPYYARLSSPRNPWTEGGPVEQAYKILYPAKRMKPVIWMGSSRNDLATFPPIAKQRAGYGLYEVQCGLEPPDWKPMPTIGAGVAEIRVHTGREFRVLYVAKFDEAVYVLHAFEKKTQRTARADVELARARLKEILRKRAEMKSQNTGSTSR
jgi:phage-related protein